MARVIPAILAESLTTIESQLEGISGECAVVQLDVCDGTFVPARSWPYTSAGAVAFEAILSGNDALPSWEEFDFEIDLMVSHSQRDALRWVQAGASRIIVHIDSPDAREALTAVQTYRSGPYAVEIGIGLPIGATSDLVGEYKGLFDYIQVMGIARMGYQGEVFDDRALSLLSTLRETYAVPLQVDGGVKLEHIPKLLRAGTHDIVIGSAIFDTPSPGKSIKEFIKAAA